MNLAEFLLPFSMDSIRTMSDFAYVIIIVMCSNDHMWTGGRNTCFWTEQKIVGGHEVTKTSCFKSVGNV